MKNILEAGVSHGFSHHRPGQPVQPCPGPQSHTVSAFLQTDPGKAGETQWSSPCSPWLHKEASVAQEKFEHFGV